MSIYGFLSDGFNGSMMHKGATTNLHTNLGTSGINHRSHPQTADYALALQLLDKH
jgi:hypothetical protein